MMSPLHETSKRSSRSGFTLLEMMMAVAIFTIVMGALYGLSSGLQDFSDFKLDQANAADQARHGILFLACQLRNAAKATLPTLPATTLTFKVARDIDGNGSAVDGGGSLELSPTITVMPDSGDSNGDGLSTSQLVMKEGTKVTVLANNLAANGVLFESVGSAVRMTIQTRATTRLGNVITNTLTETVLPRN